MVTEFVFRKIEKLSKKIELMFEINEYKINYKVEPDTKYLKEISDGLQDLDEMLSDLKNQLEDDLTPIGSE